MPDQRAEGMGADMDADKVLSTTHHTWLVGPWPGAGDGAVHVRQLDDEDSVVMILRPGEAEQVAKALLEAAAVDPWTWCSDPSCPLRAEGQHVH